MSTRSIGVRLVCLLTCLSLIAGGCTHTSVKQVAPYQPGEPLRVSQTPAVGIYKIKYASADDEELKTLHGSKRILGKGQPIGFERAEDGQVIAVAGYEKFPALLPPGARFCVWSTKTEKPSRFAQNMDALGQAAVGTAIVGGILVLAVAAASTDDDCHDDDNGYSSHRHHHKHKR
jgi:hypothetical protein